MAAAISLCSSLTPKPSHSQSPSAPFLSRPNLTFLSHSLSSLTLTARKQPALSFTVKSTDTEVAASVSEPEIETPVPESEPAVETEEPKREEVFAVVMVSRERERMSVCAPLFFWYILEIVVLNASFSEIYGRPNTGIIFDFVRFW